MNGVIRSTMSGTQVKNLPCAGALERGGQIWNHHRVELRCGDYELQIIGFPVANRAWAPMLIVDLN